MLCFLGECALFLPGGGAFRWTDLADGGVMEALTRAQRGREETCARSRTGGNPEISATLTEGREVLFNENGLTYEACEALSLDGVLY